ncbi:MAG TPA: tetratricopeptide repeat protein, partial [Pyrinomonadaceae bacterium]|nr:tetratricopeptide repeat protein [Pyrinomonadaceae bacterium]
VFAVQDAIAEQVASLLSHSLNSDERRQLARRDTENFNAYQAYIRGLYFWNKRTKEGLEKSIGYFIEAIREEPDYALAHAGLADSYALAGVFLYDFLPAHVAFENARAEALRAIELDETLPQAHAALFLVKHNYDEDAAGAEKEIRRAIELNPYYATAHLRYAFFHRDYGNLHQALAEATRAQQLDPLSMMNNYLLSEIHYLLGQMEQAAAYCEKAFETDPDVELLKLQMAYLYTQKNMYEEAIRVLEGIPEEQPVYAIQKLGELGYAFAAAGRRNKAFDALSALKAFEHEPLSNYCMALIYTGLDEKEMALRHLQAETGRFVWLRPYYSYEPRLSSLRADMRFNSLLNGLFCRA